MILIKNTDGKLEIFKTTLISENNNNDDEIDTLLYKFKKYFDNQSIENSSNKFSFSTIIPTLKTYISINNLDVTIYDYEKNHTIKVGAFHSQNLLENLRYALELFLSNSIKNDLFPSIGKPYWYVTAPSPFNVSINQGIIDEELMAELLENDGLGNIFKTKQEAQAMAKKMTTLFENHTR